MKMSRLGMAWDRWWFADTDPHPIAAFRVLVGVYLLLYLGVMIPHVPSVFSSDGVYVPYAFGDYAPSPLVASVVFAVTYALAGALMIGYRTRVVAPLLLAGVLYHYFLALAVKHSAYDRLLIVFLVVLCFAEADRVWSLHARNLRGPAKPVPVWAERVVRFQMVALYFGAGLWKLIHPAWRSGAFLEMEMQGLWATPIGFWLAGQELGPLFWVIASWGIIGFELFVGGFLLQPQTRGVAVLLLAVFHVANVVILFVPEFLLCLAGLVLFVPAGTLRGWVAQIRPRRDVVVGSPRQHA